MEFTTLEVRLEAGVATIALNRPDKANAMSEPMWYEIEQAMEWLDGTPEARVGVLLGATGRLAGGRDARQLEDHRDDVGLLGPGAGLAAEGLGDRGQLGAVLALEAVEVDRINAHRFVPTSWSGSEGVLRGWCRSTHQMR